MSRRGRLGFAAACVGVFVVLAVWVSWSAPSMAPSGKTPATVTLAPGAARPAGLAVTDLHDLAQLQARFNADQGHPRLVLALAPT
ncbi:MAG TPA: hypothetical protein VFA45_06885 [Actinomycetes bacterium]|jgi:hypothetical protein|nr:hypothetical protein [Actinomycetes bacterium]